MLARFARSGSQSHPLLKNILDPPLVRRAIRLGLYTADYPTLSQLAADWDDNLLAKVLYNPHRVLHKFLPRTKLIIPTILDLVVTLLH